MLFVQPKVGATTFLQLAVAVLISQAISTPLASLLMAKYGAILPIAFGYGPGLSLCCVCSFIPETIHPRTPKIADEEVPSEDAAEIGSSHAIKQSWTARNSMFFSSKAGNLSPYLPSPTLLASLAILFIDSFNAATINILVQYASRKLLGPISSVGSLFTIRAVMTIMVLLFVMSYIGRSIATE
ncbi:hypothetical protein ED733_004456 [Metarhizium rileyi]|uniref:Major facilitator superfamily domain, general substrate transporter n=1 Tax=Metarhizium rileyi (strain RCEF 4871) TaxID=1649241 RepID=A0A5C6GMH9_METRR|nr:hypothetical protein ED733_004456 [Metarhizium rileyi]